MTINAIRDAASHAAALARIEEILDAVPGTPEFDELEELVSLVESYEDKAFPIPESDSMERER